MTDTIFGCPKTDIRKLTFSGFGCSKTSSTQLKAATGVAPLRDERYGTREARCRLDVWGGVWGERHLDALHLRQRGGCGLIVPLRLRARASARRTRRTMSVSLAHPLVLSLSLFHFLSVCLSVCLSCLCPCPFLCLRLSLSLFSLPHFLSHSFTLWQARIRARILSPCLPAPLSPHTA